MAGCLESAEGASTRCEDTVESLAAGSNAPYREQLVGEFGPVVDVEPVVNPTPVGNGGVLADAKLAGDIVDRGTIRHEDAYLRLSTAERQLSHKRMSRNATALDG